jgi:hypothetical protein
MKSPMKVWNTGIFKESTSFDLTQSVLSHCIKVFSSKKFRVSKKHIYTIADPFLFVKDERLYLFAEINRFFDKGCIACWDTSDLTHWHYYGEVLRREYHISYPFIFCDTDGSLYMLPETSEANEVALWKFQRFPDQLVRDQVLLNGGWVDSSIILHNNLYYLFTTSKEGALHLFFSEKLKGNNWQSHPMNPLTADKAYSRNGGGVQKVNNNLYRIAQDCSEQYGAGIVIKKVNLLTPKVYIEETCVGDFRPAENYRWQQLARHHLSMVDYKNHKIAAMDGKDYDLVQNQLFSKTYTLYSRIKKALRF